LAYDPIAMPWGQHCPYVVTAMKEIAESYRLLLTNNRIHLPPVEAQIHGGNDTIPDHYPSSKFGNTFPSSAVMACLLGKQSLLIVDQKEREKLDGGAHRDIQFDRNVCLHCHVGHR
jgi:hypothetical protein